MTRSGSGADPDGRVAAARALRTPAEAIAIYATWAASYDRDVFERLGVTGTDRIADLLAEHVPDRHAAVLDVGCGTGAAGVRLRTHGFVTIDGIDISQPMLDRAAATGAYRRLVAADVHEPRPVPDASYDACVSAGTFTTGHVRPSALGGIVAALRPGAVIAWVVASAVIEEFRPALDALGLDVRHDAVEPIRRDGPPEATMLVARLPTG
ncbi:MAG: methyltransferase domain-containing protein [Acidimicrobiia bacterium]|nr:methyltransferase domain-containing protein [Acidimicrobiia bacterium]